ncbi:MAG: helix-turn-helix domain-containing protein, partial [Candidatus Ranarchaeia archaeon]
MHWPLSPRNNRHFPPQIKLSTLGTYRELQRKLARRLRKKGKTQADTAAVIGVSEKTIRNWEKRPATLDVNGTLPNGSTVSSDRASAQERLKPPD